LKRFATERAISLRLCIIRQNPTTPAGTAIGKTHPRISIARSSLIRTVLPILMLAKPVFAILGV